LRLRTGRPGRGYKAHSGLLGASEHSAHRQVHGHQPGTVSKALAVRGLVPSLDERYVKPRNDFAIAAVDKCAIVELDGKFALCDRAL